MDRTDLDNATDYLSTFARPACETCNGYGTADGKPETWSEIGPQPDGCADCGGTGVAS